MSLAISIASLLVMLPAAVFFAQSLLGSLSNRKTKRLPSGKRPSVAVLIPAHNEANVIQKTLEEIRPQLHELDKLVVVADNCTDTTAKVASSMKAEVIRRFDNEHRGKGFALHAGLTALQDDPPEVVVFIDADCRVEPHCISLLANAAKKYQLPIQASYVMHLPPNPTIQDRISAFAVITKNVVRPNGMRRMGMPCLLTGSGIAMTWDLTQKVQFDGADNVEDMRISIDLALAGSGPRFCPAAHVTSPLPQSVAAADSQRTRWEHGHLRTIRSQSPRLIAAFLKRPSLRVLATLLDLCVPPLSLLVVSYAVLAAMAIVGACFSSSLLSVPTVKSPLVWVPLSGLFLILAGCGSAWLSHGRQFLRPTDLKGAPSYLFTKLSRFISFVRQPEDRWIRTSRN